MKLSSHLNISFFFFQLVLHMNIFLSFMKKGLFLNYILFLKLCFQIKIWKKGIKRLSWGQEKRKINSFTKKFSWIFFYFSFYFIVKHFSFLHEKRFSPEGCLFFYSVTRKKNIFPPGFINKKYLDSIMKKKDKKKLF